MFKTALKQIRREKSKLLISFFSIIITTASLVMVNGFISFSNKYLNQESRNLLAGDIQISQNFPFEIDQFSSLRKLQNEGNQFSTILETSSIVSNDQENIKSANADLKIVSENYPFYSEVELESANNYLTPSQDEVYVDQALLDKLDINVGEKLLINQKEYKIKDIIVSEPDDAGSIFTFGDRILMSQDAFERSGLNKAGSRINYKVSIKLKNPENIDQIVSQIKNDFEGSTARISDFREGPQGLSTAISILRNFFLSIIVLVFFMAIIAIRSNISFFIEYKSRDIAIFKCLGMPAFNVLGIYILIIVFIAFFGGFIAEILGNILLFLLTPFLSNLIEIPLEYQFQEQSLILSMVFAIFLSLISSLAPLYDLWKIKPISVLRGSDEKISFLFKNGLFTLLSFFMLILAFWYLLESFLNAFYIIFAALFLFTFVYLINLAFIKILKKIKNSFQNFNLKAIISILNKPRSIAIITLSSLTFAFLSIFLTLFLKENILKGLDVNVDAEAPELVVLDIQDDQIDQFKEIVGEDVEVFPVVRGRIYSIDSVIIRDNLDQFDGEITRPFNLTYRNNLIEGEKLIKGELWTEENFSNEVSVSADEAERFNIELGSEIVFDIQGVQLPLKVTGIRKLNIEGFQPFFYFVTPPDILKEAGGSGFAFLDLSASQALEIQNELARKIPTVSIIRAKEALEKVREITIAIAMIIIYLSQGAVLIGLVMLAGLILANAQERENDFMLMKVLGANKAFIRSIYLLELAFYSVFAFFIAYFLAALAAFLINNLLFDFTEFFWVFSPFYILPAAFVISFLIGIFALKRVFASRVMCYLRRGC